MYEFKKIKNTPEILARGDVSSKKIVLELTDRTLQKLDAYHTIKRLMRLEGEMLYIGTKSWDLSKKRHVYLLGAGKACNAMAMAVDEVLGDRLTKGIIVVKVAEDSDVFRRTEVHVGGHPLPNEAGYRACLKMLDLVNQAQADDLFIVTISGGSSALMNCPLPGISIQDEIDATDILLKTGAGIYEINAVRRHISQMNGGRLAERIAGRGAELIGFGISDAVGSPATKHIEEPYAAYKSTPMGPDATTLEDARNVIFKYRLEDRLPKTIVQYLMNVGPEGETPKAFPQNTYYLLNTLPDACAAAREAAAEMGIPAITLSSFVEGESREVGKFFGAIAREIQTYGNPVKGPCLVISAGEATTKIEDSRMVKGHGGPSQEMTASCAQVLSKAPGACMLSIDSEGTDGTTPCAGGIVDSQTAGYAEALGVHLQTALDGHACYEALGALGAIVMTGNTGTNLCDFNVLYVPTAQEKGGV